MSLYSATVGGHILVPDAHNTVISSRKPLNSGQFFRRLLRVFGIRYPVRDAVVVAMAAS